MTETILRLLSAIAVTGAAIMLTMSWRKWAHSLVRPAARYAAIVMWITALYRWHIFGSFVEPGGEFALLIRLIINVLFIAIASAFILYAASTYEWHKKQLTIGRK